MAALLLTLLLSVALLACNDDEVQPVPLGPRIGDHWHARYQIVICGQRQPNMPMWEGGVHTHGDGVMHIHPLTAAEEGAGASLEKFFAYAAAGLGQDWNLTATSITLGDGTRYGNGDSCPDGRPGTVQVYVNGEPLADFTGYVPQDDDSIVIRFD